jgi:hypothetical protein
MLRFQWNALRVGNKVLMHDPRDVGMRLLAGVVTIVDSRKGSNDIAIRVSPKGESSQILRPRRLAVHLDAGDAAEACWRCADIASAPAHSPLPEALAS